MSIKSLLFTTTAAVTVAGLLTAPVPALAMPMVPLAPVCDWKLPSYFYIEQNNGLEVSVPTDNNNKSSGRAGYGKPGNPNTTGNAEGGLNGTNISFIMRWDNGGQNNYDGVVHPDGSTSGTTRNETNHTNTWTGKGTLACVTAPTPPAGGGTPGAGATGGGTTEGGATGRGPVVVPPPATATVLQEDNIYNMPDGIGKVYKEADGVKIFAPPGKVQLATDPARCNDWCHITTNLVPGDAWIYSASDFVTKP